MAKVKRLQSFWTGEKPEKKKGRNQLVGGGSVCVCVGGKVSLVESMPINVLSQPLDEAQGFIFICRKNVFQANESIFTLSEADQEQTPTPGWLDKMLGGGVERCCVSESSLR